MEMRKYLLKLKQIPVSWQEPVQISEAKRDIITKAIKEKFKENSFKSIFVYGAPNILFQTIIENRNIKDIKGIDFIKYFENTFNNEKENEKVAPITFIYNIGFEPAVNTKFSQKLLNKLLQQLKDNNYSGIFISTMTYTEFIQQYNITFVNKITLPNKIEEKIF